MVERKYMAHFIDASFGGNTASWYRLGTDLEEFNIELNPDIEQGKNILGEATFHHKGYEESGEVEPYYADPSDEIFEALQAIVDERKTGDDLETDYLEVHLWDSETSGAYPAYKQKCHVVPSSYGGDTSGYQIPFTIYPHGTRVAGTFNPTTKTWTAAAG